MHTVAGKLNKQDAIDRIHRAYREKCIDFATEFGYDIERIAGWFEQCAFMRVREQGMHFNLASWMAMRDVCDCFWKPGSAETSN